MSWHYKTDDKIPYPATDKTSHKRKQMFWAFAGISHDSSVPSVSPYLVHKILKNWFLKSSAKEDVTK